MNRNQEDRSLPILHRENNTSCGCNGGGCGCSDESEVGKNGYELFFERKLDRRSAMSSIAGSLMAGLGLLNAACSPFGDSEKAELEWEDYFKKNFRLMNDEEKEETVTRLERLYEKNNPGSVNIAATGPRDRVLYGYAFNISRCKGYMDCVTACIAENNQDRKSGMQYIQIHELENGSLNFH